MRARTILACLWLVGSMAVGHAGAESDAAEPEWLHIGPLRIRDLTPFGIQRLDFLPATALPQAPHTWSLEANLSYQNTFVLSENVAEYLEAKGGGQRVAFTPEDARHFFEGDEEAYLIDGELGLFDLTASRRFDRHWTAYLTVPVLFYADGVFDEFIESFHEQFGFDTAHRELVKQDDLTVMSRLGDRRLALFEPPDDGFGDPVFGGRYQLYGEHRKWNLIGEAAVKIAFRDTDFFHSSGRDDYGVQLSAQRFFGKQALYISASEVYFNGFDRDAIDPPPIVRNWITTVIVAYERRFWGPLNGIFQFYTSPSTVEGTTLEDVAERKFQLSGGLQMHHGVWVYRFAVTENLRNFQNTPDAGVTLSVARVVLGRQGQPTG